MKNHSLLSRAALTMASIVSLAGFASAQEVGAVARNMAEMKFVTIPPLPTCATGSVQSGDPTKGASVILARAAAGCTFPWHWHTPTEQVMMVRGAGRVQMKDGKPVTLKAGGFALMPSHHIHEFRCTESCVLFIYSDAAFDMHYVDAQGIEIPPDQALKAVKETAATEMK